jgi:hypothetical protein
MPIFPVLVGLVAEWNCGENGQTITNGGPSTVYYRDEQPVTSTVNDGSLASGASVDLVGSQNFRVTTANVSLTAIDLPVQVLIGSSNPEDVNTVAATGATEALPDIDVATVHYLTLDANCTITFPTAAAGKSFSVALKQDATGSRTVTWPGTVQWSGGVTPVLTTTAAKRDLFSFVCVDGTNWIGVFAVNDV